MSAAEKPLPPMRAVQAQVGAVNAAYEALQRGDVDVARACLRAAERASTPGAADRTGIVAKAAEAA